jgi:hypothetical protein
MIPLEVTARSRRKAASDETAAMLNEVAPLGDLSVCLELRAASLSVGSGVNHAKLVNRGLDAAGTTGEPELADIFARVTG